MAEPFGEEIMTNLLGGPSLCALCRTIVACVIVLCWVCPSVAHPLDSLSREEIAAAVAVLREAGHIDATTRFALIDLDEPRKADVLAWKPADPFVRKAFMVARRDRTVYEAVVELGARKIERWEAIPNVQSGLVGEELQDAERITKANAEWQAAMRKRGYTAFENLFCSSMSAGYVADLAEEGRRLVKVVCFDRAGSRVNWWGRPVEGLHAVVDLDEKRVVRLVDTGEVPVSREAHEFGDAIRPASVETAAKHSFTIDSSEVRWNKWSFHFRMGQRVGLVLSLLRFEDQSRERMVLYRGSIAEMFVPYMDPDRGWSFRTFMDVGEYGAGLLSSPLIRGIDCPVDAAFIDVVLPNERGDPVVRKSAVCLF
jgi:primary-amine oxidase